MRAEQDIDLLAKRFLQELLLTIENKSVAIRNNEHMENLHEFRVAIRKTQVLLSLLKNITFSLVTVRKFRREFYWLRSVSGPARDLDVHLLAYDDFIKYLPANKKKDLDNLLLLLQKERQKEQLRLTKKLESKRYQRLIDDWGKNINRLASQKAEINQEEFFVVHLASLNIWRTYRKILAKGTKKNSKSSPKALHNLRKKCKTLRYYIEFFQHNYPQKKLKPVLVNLKNLQNCLGKFQDLSVQHRFLEQYLSSLNRADHNDESSYDSIIVLIRKIEKKREKVRQEFQHKFRVFSNDEHKLLYRSLFKIK